MYLPGRQLVSAVYFHLIEGSSPEAVNKLHGQLREAEKKSHPWLNLGANPFGSRAGKRGPGRPAARRSGPPPGWVSDDQNVKNMAPFLMGTGNAGTVMEIARSQSRSKEVTS